MYRLKPGSARRAPGRKFRKRDMACRNSWWVGKKWIEMTWNAWNECFDMNQLTWTNWKEWIELNERKALIEMKELKSTAWHEWLTWMTWSEWIDMNELKSKNWSERIDWNEWGETNDLNWMNWNEGIEVNDLTWMNWKAWIELNEWNTWIEMQELKSRTWHEWIDMNELTWRNWDEWLDMNELKWMTCKEWIERNEFPKVFRSPQFFLRFLSEIELSLHLVDLIFNQCSQTVSFYLWFVCEIELSLLSRAHFADLIFIHFPKVVRRCHFFTILCDQLLDDDVVDIWNRTLATALCTFCRPLSRIEARNRGNRDPPAATADSHFTWKKTQGFAPESVFKREFTRSRSLTLPNYRCWCGWHDDWDDDVGAMMLRQLATDNRL